jgi:hypothetical protein
MTPFLRIVMEGNMTDQEFRLICNTDLERLFSFAVSKHRSFRRCRPMCAQS